MHNYYDTNLKYLIFILMFLTIFVPCSATTSKTTGESTISSLNPVSYFEIPVSDIERAITFYEKVFSIKLERSVIDGHDMALFPYNEHASGISGALAKGDSYQPSISGPRMYFSVENIDKTLAKVERLGGEIAYPKTAAGTFWVAEFIDSEGNQIALSSTNE